MQELRKNHQDAAEQESGSDHVPAGFAGGKLHEPESAEEDEREDDQRMG